MQAILVALIASCGGPAPMLPPPSEGPPWFELSGLERQIAMDRACGRGDGDACWFLGVARRWADPPDLDGAWAAWSRGCDLRAGLACEAAALATDRGEGTRANLGAALQVARRGCDMGHPPACGTVAAYEAVLAARVRCSMESEAGLDADACALACRPGATELVCARAGTLQSARCDGGDAAACTWLGTAAALGLPVGFDDPDARLWQGCDGDDPWGCVRLADRVHRGVGRNASPKSLDWLDAQGCDLQLDLACAPHAR